MARYVSWLANAALFTLCAFFFSTAANAVFAALLAPPPAPASPDAGQGQAPSERTWNDRQVILARNLFNASLLAPPQPDIPEVLAEDLEDTKLPLTLLGTVASPDPAIARAAVENQETRKHEVLQINDEVVNGRAKVIRIERQRLVLSENGALRELTFPDKPGAAPRPKVTRTSRTSRAASPKRRGSSRRRPTVTRPPTAADVDEAIRNPADLFSQARILPKWEDGQMVGVQVSSIKDGSLFQALGIENGEVITQLNGIQIDSPEASAEVMLELSESNQLNVTVTGPGGERTLELPTGAHR